MTFKERRFECQGCGAEVRDCFWDGQQPAPCACGGRWADTGLPMAVGRNRGVIDDQIEGGPRFFENFGHEPVWVDSKSEYKRQLEKHNAINLVRHDAAYYAKQRKQHDEMLRDTGQLVTQPRVR